MRESESEVAQSCPTLSDPMDCSLPGSSVHGILQARVLEWGAIALSIYLLVITNSLSLSTYPDRYCANMHYLCNNFVRQVSLSPFYKLKLRLNEVYIPLESKAFNTGLHPLSSAHSTQYLLI